MEKRLTRVLKDSLVCEPCSVKGRQRRLGPDPHRLHRKPQNMIRCLQRLIHHQTIAEVRRSRGSSTGVVLGGGGGGGWRSFPQWPCNEWGSGATVSLSPSPTFILADQGLNRQPAGHQPTSRPEDPLYCSLRGGDRPILNNLPRLNYSCLVYFNKHLSLCSTFCISPDRHSFTLCCSYDQTFRFGSSDVRCLSGAAAPRLRSLWLRWCILMPGEREVREWDVWRERRKRAAGRCQAGHSPAGRLPVFIMKHLERGCGTIRPTCEGWTEWHGVRKRRRCAKDGETIGCRQDGIKRRGCQSWEITSTRRPRASVGGHGGCHHAVTSCNPAEKWQFPLPLALYIYIRTQLGDVMKSANYCLINEMIAQSLKCQKDCEQVSVTVWERWSLPRWYFLNEAEKQKIFTFGKKQEDQCVWGWAG